MLVLWVVGVVERVGDNCEVLEASCCCCSYSYSFLASNCSYSYSCLEVVFRILVVHDVVLHKDDEQVVHEDVDVDADAADKKELVGPLPLLDVSFFP